MCSTLILVTFSHCIYLYVNFYNFFSMIMIPDSEQELRLVDDAFGKVCSGLTDLSMYVRTLAAQLLGSMTLVSSHFLNQTLDKKLMSNMRRKVCTNT